MIKVKGFRIELGEIEQALAKHEGLDEFVVVAIPDENYGNRLFCYYSTLPKHSVEPTDLKNFLQGKLPEYFVPYKFIQKDVLPKTTSGKVDRMQLTALSKE